MCSHPWEVGLCCWSKGCTATPTHTGSWPIGITARPLSADQLVNPGSGRGILPPHPRPPRYHARYDVAGHHVRWSCSLKTGQVDEHAGRISPEALDRYPPRDHDPSKPEWHSG